MRKICTSIAVAALITACSRSYYLDAEVLSAYQRQAQITCAVASASTRLATCRRAKACADPAQRGLEAILAYQQASAAMTASVDDRLVADAAFAAAVAACGVAGIVPQPIAASTNASITSPDGGSHD